MTVPYPTVWVKHRFDPQHPHTTGRWFAVELLGDESPEDAVASIRELSWVEAALTDADYQERVRYLEMTQLEELRRMSETELLAEREYREGELALIQQMKGEPRTFYLSLQASSEMDAIWVREIDREIRRRQTFAAQVRRNPWGADAAFIRDLKDRVPLHEFIVHELPHILLKRVGNVYQAKCPYHADQNPSFTVYETHFICFGCGVHGDCFDLCQQLLGKPGWREAVEHVAAYALVPIPRPPIPPSEEVQVQSL